MTALHGKPIGKTGKCIFAIVAALVLLFAFPAMAYAEAGTTASQPQAEAGTTASQPQAEAGTTASQPQAEAGTTASQPQAEAGTTASQPQAEAGTTAPQPQAKSGATELQLQVESGPTEPQPQAKSGTTEPQPPTDSSDGGTDSTAPDTENIVTDVLTTATIAEHNVSEPVAVPSSNTGETTTDRMTIPTDAVVKSEYTFDNEAKTTMQTADDGSIETVNDTNTAVQRAIEKAFSEIDPLSTTVTIVIKDGTYAGDLNIDCGNLPNTMSGYLNNGDLQIVLAAADAIRKDADGDLLRTSSDPYDFDYQYAVSAGNVKIDGNITIDGIDVILAGIYLTLGKKISVTDAELTVYGTELADTYNISLSSSSNAYTDWTGTTVHGNGGADAITVDMPSQIIKNTIGNENYAPRGGIYLFGDVGNDSLTVSGKAMATLKDGNQHEASRSDAPGQVIELNGGAGDDTLTTSLALVRSAREILLDGGEGTGDRVHFLGALATLSTTLTSNIELIEDENQDWGIVNATSNETAKVIAFTTAVNDEFKDANNGDALITKDRVFTAYILNVENYTDGLTNKAEVTISFDTDGVLKKVNINTVTIPEALPEAPPEELPLPTISFHDIGGLAPFTNYLYVDVGEYDVTQSKFEGSSPTHAIRVDGAQVFLSNLMFSADTLLIQYDIIAEGMNLVFYGKKITFTSPLYEDGNPILTEAPEIVGACITVTALDSDTQFGFDVKEHETQTDTYDVAFSLFDCASTASITVDEGAKLESKSGALVLSATTSQTKGLIDLAGASGSLNFINVKVGSATINILGTLISSSTVNATAKATVTISGNNSMLANAFIPLAVSVCVLESDVTVGNTGKITAAGSVSLSASNVTTITTRSTTGKLPISLAVSVAVINTHVKVYGEVASTNENVSLTATGNTIVTTNADKGTAIPMTGAVFGGFFTFSVVLQDVSAFVGREENDAGLLTEGGRISAANGNVSITSTSNEKVTANATSSSAGGDSGSDS